MFLEIRLVKKNDEVYQSCIFGQNGGILCGAEPPSLGPGSSKRANNEDRNLTYAN
jgi:hypothetical protein